MSEVDDFLSSYTYNEQTAAYEYYTSLRLSEILVLSHYEKASDPGSGERIVWYGQTNPIKKSFEGNPDMICNCKGYSIIGEASLGDQNNQWRQELSTIEKHYDEHLQNTGMNQESLLTLFMCRNINEYSLANIAPILNKTKMALLTETMLTEVGEIAKIVPFIGHFEIRSLLADLNDLLKSSSEPDQYISKGSEKIDEWGKKILESQKYILFGLESYKILREQTQPYLDIREIYAELEKKNRIVKLLSITNSRVSAEDITKSITEHRFATYVGRAQEAKLYAPVPVQDLDATYRKILADALQ